MEQVPNSPAHRPAQPAPPSCCHLVAGPSLKWPAAKATFAWLKPHWIGVRIKQATVQASTGQLYWFPFPAGGRPHTQVASTGHLRWFTPCTTRPLLVPPSSCWALGACVVQMKQVHKTTTGQSARSPRPNLAQLNLSRNLASNQPRIIFCLKMGTRMNTRSKVRRYMQGRCVHRQF